MKCPELFRMNGYEPEPCAVEDIHKQHANRDGSIKWTLKEVKGNGTIQEAGTPEHETSGTAGRLPEDGQVPEPELRQRKGARRGGRLRGDETAPAAHVHNDRDLQTVA